MDNRSAETTRLASTRRWAREARMEGGDPSSDADTRYVRRDDLHPGLPRLPRTYLPRRRLWERLDHTADSAVTLLIAPAGAGKTLGVAGWLQYSSVAPASDAGWLQADPDLSPSRLAEVMAEGPTPATGGTGEPRLLVVDDAHLLSAACLRVLDQRLNTQPEAIKLLLLSRWDLPLTRLVPELLGHLSVVRGDVLLMTDDEAAELIEVHARTSDVEVLTAIRDYARGWCAAVVLAARTVANAPDPATAARRLLEHNAPVPDRVAGDVFASLSPRQRHVLLCLAAESLVTPSQARHLANDALAGDILDELEATGFLVARVPARGPDRDEPCYQIHPLLAEVVRRRIVGGGVDAERARATVVRAVRLDLATGESDAAFTRLIAVSAMSEAADLVAAEGVQIILGHGAGAQVADLPRTHPEAVDGRPDTWFALALQRWVVDDVPGARHWAERLIQAYDDGDEDPTYPVEPMEVACARLWRARLGLEPMLAAMGFAKRVLMSQEAPLDPGVRPVLFSELGIAQNWLGETAQAEATLTSAIGLSRTQQLFTLATSAMTHLAFTEYAAGRERASVEVATEALASLDAQQDAGPARFAGSRAFLALLLGTLVDLPWSDGPIEDPDTRIGNGVHSADLSTTFWMRIRGALLALSSGSVVEAERVLQAPADSPMLAETNLPDHLRVVLLVQRAFLASLASDRMSLSSIEQVLSAMRMRGEAALVHGLHADLDGDPRRAADSFAAAAADATFAQPPTRALALACQAQLLDALGDRDAALGLLATATTECAVRRNAVPFLGWVHLGTPMQTLLAELERQSPTTWVSELAAASQGRLDVTAYFATRTATPSERGSAPQAQMRPALSTREREVLGELARGSTYADIAANLFVSENTVKTHVSGLYSKLSVSRRSEALAVARSHGLI
jgi:DNA-binding CsgD family transcriptional regulator